VTQKAVNFLIPFKTLLEAISGLSLEEKRHLRQLLDEQIAKTEAQTKEQTSTAQTEIQEAGVAYQTGDDVAEENAIQIEVLEVLKGLTTTERLTIIEATLDLIREDLQQIQQSRAWVGQRQQLATAAKALLPDYKAGGELTAFTTLDGEDFYA
jgi:hypothetical protein